MSASVVPATDAAGSAAAAGKKRKEPSEAELAQQQLIDEIFSREKHASLARALQKLDEQYPAAKKTKTESASSSSSAAAAEPNPFVAAMDSIPDARTANNAATFSTTKSPTLDLFFHLVRGFPAEDVQRELSAAWKEDPETALRILLHARDCHGAGKGEKLAVRHALLWLRQHKPRTYLANLLEFLRAGYLKDLVLLADMLDGSPAEAVRAPPVKTRKGTKPKKITESEAELAKARRGKLGALRKAGPSAAVKSRWGPLGGPELELSLLAEFLRSDYVKLRNWLAARKKYREAQKAAGKAPASAEAKAEPTTDALSFDEAEQVELDDLNLGDDEGWEDVEQASQKVEKMAIDEKADSSSSSSDAAPPKSCFISLAAKWAPSERKAFPGQAKALARLLFNDGVQFRDQKQLQNAMKRYRTLLSSLRRHLCVTERLCCEGKWDKINFNAVPSKAHQLLKKAFMKHVPEKYNEYLAGLKKGVGKINVTGLEPHQLVEFYLHRGELNDTVEEAWKALLARVREEGSFSSAVSVVDVSGSMTGTPMNVAISMGLMIAELCEGPFHNRVLTFHEQPSWHTIQGDTLRDQVKNLANAPWGGSTNLQATFDLILEMAVEHKVEQKHLPKTMFIFSDMQFDQAVGRYAGGGNWMETNYQACKRKFEQAGYEVPQIVFWNVNGKLCHDAPVQCDQEGCALMSGFSPMLLKVFLSGKVDPKLQLEAPPEQNPLHPITIMNDAIKGYTVVVDDSER